MASRLPRSLTLVAAGFVAGLGAAAGLAVAQGSPTLHGGPASLLQGSATDLYCVSGGPNGMQVNRRQITVQAIMQNVAGQQNVPTVRVNC